MMTSQTFWDGIARSYAARPIQNLDEHNRTVERAASYLTPEAEMLEVGCGTGTIALRLAERARYILAVDISDALLDIARDRAAAQGVETVDFAQHDVAALPPGQFDAVMSFNVLHLIRDIDAALAEMTARIRPGGVLVIKAGCLAETWQGRMLRPVIRAMRLVGKAPYVGFMGVHALESAIERQGLHIVEAENMGGKIVTRFVVARKPA